MRFTTVMSPTVYGASSSGFSADDFGVLSLAIMMEGGSNAVRSLANNLCFTSCKLASRQGQNCLLCITLKLTVVSGPGYGFLGNNLT